MKIICFGDSLTYGNIGYSYRKFIDTKHQIVNKGINGDTTIHVFERLKRYLEQKDNGEADIYVIAVGTNDLLLPYISTISPQWRVLMKAKLSKMRCILDDGKFAQEYENYFKLLKEHKKRAIVVGMPICELVEYPNERVRHRNEIIKRLAGKYQVPYVDIESIQRAMVSSTDFTHSWNHKFLIRLLDGVIMTINPWSKEWYSHIRHLQLTVDGVHYNLRTAKKLGIAVTKALRRY